MHVINGDITQYNIVALVCLWSRAGSGVVRIDPLRFMAGYRNRRLNQALSVPSLSLGFFDRVFCAVN